MLILCIVVVSFVSVSVRNLPVLSGLVHCLLVDLEHQQQALEQIKVLAHFKQLRQIQQQQQLDLIRQQQARIEAMRVEQERVQHMLNKGSKLQQPAAAKASHSAPNLTHRKHPSSDGHSLANKVGQGDSSCLSARAAGDRQLFTARRNDSAQSAAVQTTPKRRPGIPVPTLPSVPSTPSEYRVNGNPDLESEVGSVYADIELEEGFAPLDSDSASETGSMTTAAACGFVVLDNKQRSEESFAMRTGNLNLVAADDNETSSQPDLASLHELNSKAWKARENAITQSALVHNLSSQSNTVTSQNAQHAISQLYQPPPGYIHLLQLPSMLEGLPDSMLQQLLRLQQNGQSVIIDAQGHLAVHDVNMDCVLPAGGMLGALSFDAQPDSTSHDTRLSPIGTQCDPRQDSSLTLIDEQTPVNDSTRRRTQHKTNERENLVRNGFDEDADSVKLSLGPTRGYVTADPVVPESERHADFQPHQSNDVIGVKSNVTPTAQFTEQLLVNGNRDDTPDDNHQGIVTYDDDSDTNYDDVDDADKESEVNTAQVYAYSARD